MNKTIAKMKTLRKGDWLKSVLTGLAVLFSVFSIVWFAAKTEWDDMALSCAGIAYTLIPFVCERLFRFRIQPTLYVFVIAYTVCPLLGSSYQLYLKFSWWDDLLHGFAGLIFAVFGAYLPRALNKEKTYSIALCALMGFVFSVAVSGVWEAIEFGMDSIFGTDMQKDTWLTSTRPSYLLAKILGLPDGVVVGNDTNIVTVINGIEYQGYLDIGLLDSMHDMLIETLGALIYTVVYIVFKGKKFAFLPYEQTTPAVKCEPSETLLQEVAISESAEQQE